MSSKVWLVAMVLIACQSWGASRAPDLLTRAGLQQKDLEVAEEIFKLGKERDYAYRLIESLTTEIGPRLGGSPAEARARSWAIKKMKEMGLRAIRVDKFPIPFWERIEEKAEVLGASPQNLAITNLGGSVSTPPQGVTGSILRFPNLAALRKTPTTKIRGKIVFIDEKMQRTKDVSGYAMAVTKRREGASLAGSKGAKALLIRSVGTDSHRFPHTGMMKYQGKGPKIPAAALSAPDADQLVRLLERDAKLKVRIKLRSRTKKSRPSGNVIGELPGENGQWILIGAHLDSWDLGTGAVDDGAGVGIVMGAMELLKSLDRPMRTGIRVVLFGAEEVGIYGGKHYAKTHKAELSQHRLAMESDLGAGPVWRLDTHFSTSQKWKAEILQKFLQTKGIQAGHNQTNGGPDLYPLREAQVPVLNLLQNGWDYFDLHHTSNDTFDKISKKDVAQNVAAWASTLWLVSQMEDGFR